MSFALGTEPRYRPPAPASAPASRQRRGGDARLVVDRRDEPVDDAAVLGALADREHAGQARAHRVVDDDAAVADDAHRARELGLRADADRDDDEVGHELRAVGEAQAVGAVGADDLLRVAVELDVDVQAAQRGREQRAGAGVELALHEAVEQVHDGHRRSPARRCRARPRGRAGRRR